MTSRHLLELVEISRRIGTDVANVQGGGGNTSMKDPERGMLIKASGSLLKNMTKEVGYSVVDHKAINDYLKNPDKCETVFSNRIKSFVLETKNRPSIETGFHACLGKAVIHSHSVYANILSCSVEGKSIANKIIPNVCWVEYKSPGRELTLAVKQVADDLDKSKDIIIILQNHGLIVSSSSAKRALELHESINSRIMSELNVPEFFATEYLKDVNPFKVDQGVLFPDQVVYTISDPEAFLTDAAKEILASYQFLLKVMKDLNFSPNFLNSLEIDFIREMESEKYRLKVLKNDSYKT